MSDRTPLPAILTLLVTLTFVLSPLVTEPFSGFSEDQLPLPQIDPPVQPAGYAFAIWGVIYAWLVASAVFGLLRRTHDAGWTHARWPLIASLALGTPWLAVATQSAIWATLLIFPMAATAIWALLRSPSRDMWWFGVPVGLYAGWLTAASFVSLGSTAAGHGILTGAMGWAYIGILGAAAVAVAVLRVRPALAYAAAVLWALAGIIAANGTATPGVSALAAAAFAALLALTILSRRST